MHHLKISFLQNSSPSFLFQAIVRDGIRHDMAKWLSCNILLHKKKSIHGKFVISDIVLKNFSFTASVLQIFFLSTGVIGKQQRTE